MKLIIDLRIVVAILALLAIPIIFSSIQYQDVYRIISEINECGGSVHLSLPDETPGQVTEKIERLTIWQYCRIRSRGVAVVRLTECEPSDRLVQNVCSLGTVEVLDLEQSQFNDEQLVAFKDLKRLGFVRLMDTNVSESGFKRLQQTFPGLETNRNFKIDKLLVVFEKLMRENSYESSGPVFRRR